MAPVASSLELELAVVDDNLASWITDMGMED